MFAKLPYLPQRYVFAIMGFHVTMIGYMMRVSLDVTMHHMVNQTIANESQLYDPYSCLELSILPNQTDFGLTEHATMGSFDWDANVQQSVSSIFRTSFSMTQLIGGMVAESKGGKKLMGIALLILSISTAAIPVASKMVGSNGLIVLRFLSGMASGTIIPILLSMMSKWVPVDEQAFIGSIIFPGSLIGYVAGIIFGKQIVMSVGWEPVYYIFGLMGAVCWFCWKVFVYSTPNEHPEISEDEKSYLNENVPSLQRTTKYDLDPLPWKALLRCGPFWGTVIGYLGHEWAFSNLATQVPQFMKDVLRLDISTLPLLGYMPYVSMWLAALLFGVICDIIVKRGCCSLKNARKIFTAIDFSINFGPIMKVLFCSMVLSHSWTHINFMKIGSARSIGAAFCIIMVMYSGCNRIMTVFWMFLGMTVLGAYYSGCVIGVLNIAPNYAGSMIGLIDLLAVNTAASMPKISALVVSDALLQQWRLYFWIMAIFLVFSIVVYCFYVQAEPMWWDDVRKNGYPKSWKNGLLSCDGLIDENGKSIYPKTKKNIEEENRSSEA